MPRHRSSRGLADPRDETIIDKELETGGIYIFDAIFECGLSQGRRSIDCFPIIIGSPREFVRLLKTFVCGRATYQLAE